MGWLKIDEVAKLTGLTKRAIRYYEEIGLIQPPERSDGQYRLYSEEDVNLIQKVVDAKEVLGFSLQELQQFLSIKNTIANFKEQYIQTKEKKQLLEILEGLKEQDEMLHQKLNKMEAFSIETKKLIAKVEQLLETE